MKINTMQAVSGQIRVQQRAGFKIYVGLAVSAGGVVGVTTLQIPCI
jgi:hypothetical protein